MKGVPVPNTLSERQIQLAKAYAVDKFRININVIDFCSKYKVGSATWSKWNKEEVFQSYLVAVQGSLIPEDKWATYDIVKRKIERLASAGDAGVKEIELYLKTFDFMVLADKQRQMDEMGITPAHEKKEFKTLEERKATLLARLKG